MARKSPSNLDINPEGHEEHSDVHSCDQFNLTLTLNHTHNHDIASAQALRYHPVSENTRNAFYKLFEEDYTASQAYTKYREDLQLKMGLEEYTKHCADRSLLPDYKWVFREHLKYKLAIYGRMNSPESYQKVADLVEKYNTEMGAELAKFSQEPDGHYICVLLDQLTLRVHKSLPQSGDVVMIDATSNLDRCDSKVFRIVTPSPGGAMPLGTIIVSSESQAILVKAFAMYKSILPTYAFYGRGSRGPVCFITDDCEAEYQSFLIVFPESLHLLCQFHLLQATWRWIWAGAHKIEHRDRKTLINLFRPLVYAETEVDFNEKLENFEHDEAVQKYPQFLAHIQKMYLGRAEKWARYKRAHLPTHGNDTTNYIECSFRILKDKVFNRTKAYNLPDLLLVFIKEDSKYFRDKCIDLGNSRVNQEASSKYKIKESNISAEHICDLGDGLFKVQSESDPDKIYELSMITGYCTCPRGVSRAPCKHKNAVSKHFGIANFTTMPTYDAAARKQYTFLATGKYFDDTFFRNFCPVTSAMATTTASTTTATTTSTTTAATSTVTNSMTSAVPSSSTVSVLNTTTTSSPVSETSLTNMIDRARASVSNNLLAPNTNNEDEEEKEEDSDRNDHQDKEDNDDMDNAFPEAGEPALNNDDAEAEFDVEMQDLDQMVESFKNRAKEQWGDPTFKRAFKSFKNNFKKTLGNDNTLVRVMFNFGKETTQTIQTGRKRKNGNNIPIQSSSKARRGQEAPGMRITTPGRKENAIKKRTQMILDHDDQDEELTWHSLPSVTRSKMKRSHNLSESIENNVAAARKHEKTMF